MKFAILGLGKMGSNIALQALEKGFDVVGFDLERKSFLEKKGVKLIDDIKDIKAALKQPRIVFMWIPAGPIVDETLSILIEVLDAGDIVVDAGNSFFRDSQARHKRLRKHNLNFIDAGTSGGLEGARSGANFMVGGDEDAVNQVKPIFEKLAVKEGYIHTGEAGSGHFVKLMHNAIEFGMLQAIGEGVAMLEKSDFNLDLKGIFNNWSNGSVIRSWLIELMAQGYGEDFDEISSYVEDTGEVNWAIEEALNMEVPIPVIAQSVMELFKSREDSNVAAKAVALMRHGFGGHPFGKAEGVAKERRTGKVGLQ